MKIGIDVGGTKTEGILINDAGKELSRNRIKTEKNYDGTISGIISIVKKFENDFGDSKIEFGVQTMIFELNFVFPKLIWGLQIWFQTRVRIVANMFT